MNINKLKKVWTNEVYQSKNTRVKISLQDNDKFYYGNEFSIIETKHDLEISVDKTQPKIESVQRFFNNQYESVFEIDVNSLNDSIRTLLSRRKKNDIFRFNIANDNLIVDYMNMDKKYKEKYSAFYNQKNINNSELNIVFALNRKFVQNVIDTASAYGMNKVQVLLMGNLNLVLFFVEDEFKIIIPPVVLRK